jgi:ribonuclease BN (tRNA processing enzyme)
MDFSYFPVEVIELEAKLEYHDLGRRTFRIGELQVRTHHFNHTVYMLGYRLEGAGKVLVYTGDHEPYWDFLFTGEKDLETFCEQEEVQRSIQQRNQEVTDFVRGADLLICDAQYFSLEEYEAHRGWGHSSAYHAADLAMQTEVKQLALFHHDPNRTDRQLDELEQAIKKYVTEKGYPGIDVFAAREGMEIDL